MNDKQDPQGVLTSGFVVDAPGTGAQLTFVEGTVCRSQSGSILSWIKFKLNSAFEKYPRLPEESNKIHSYYDLTPHGATFEPPPLLTLAYDTALIPEDMGEDNLRIATYDQTTGQWGALDTNIDKNTKTISTDVNVFSLYTIVVILRPANISPVFVSMNNQIYAGDKFVIVAYVENSGDVNGFYEAALKINDKTFGISSAMVQAKGKETLSFEVAGLEAGTYTLDIDGFTKEFTVLAKAGTPPVTTSTAPPAGSEPPSQGTIASGQVETSSPPSTTTEPSLPADTGLDWWLWLLAGCAGIVVIVALALYFAQRHMPDRLT